MKYVNVTVNHQPSSKKIVILSLNAPHNLNAINQELYEELKQSLEEISKDETVGACKDCSIRFSISRNCGQLFCAR